MRAMQAKWTFGMRSIQSREERVVVKLGAFRAPSLIRYVAAWPMCDAVLRCELTLFGIGRVKMQSKHDAVHQVRMQFSLGMGFFLWSLFWGRLCKKDSFAVHVWV
jgi:hypothetical protein